MVDRYKDSTSNRVRKLLGKRRQLRSFARAGGTTNSALLNEILSAIPTPHYLEIGLSSGLTFEAIRAIRKVGVDPVPAFKTRSSQKGLKIHACTSDEFFARSPITEEFDLIYLDGLHESRQTFRDMRESLSHLKNGGMIVVDDTLPTDWISAVNPQVESLRLRKEHGLQGEPWHGDVWKCIESLSRSQSADRFRWNTITDHPNPKTLIWRRPDFNAQLQLEHTEPTLLTYSDVFGSDHPLWLRPSSTPDALAAWIADRLTMAQ